MTHFIKYALVAHETVIISDYQLPTETTNFRSFAQKILEQNHQYQGTKNEEQELFIFQALFEPDKMVYLCITSKDCVSWLRSTFCNELKQRWKNKYGNLGSNVPVFSQIESFRPTMEQLFGTFNTERTKKIALLHESLHDQTYINISINCA